MRSLGSAPRYRLEERLGEGGMGVVHAATMLGPAGERRVAMKRLGAADAPPDVARAARERLLAEGRLVFQLTHANICQVIDLAESDDGATHIVMEYVEGADLARLLRRLGRLELPLALYVAREVARALDYAHRKTDVRGRSLHVVHGDVSCRNVLLSIEGEVKLADFGISRALGIAAPGSELLGGTPGFVAPEVADGVFDTRADIYGLGVCLYVALSGQWPQHDEVTLDRLSLARPEASRSLEEIVARATARTASARFQSAGELEEALTIELSRAAPGFRPSHLAEQVRQVVATAPPPVASRGTGTVMRSLASTRLDRSPVDSAAPEGATRTLSRSSRRSRRRIAMLALATAGVAAAAGVVWNQRSAERADAPRQAASPSDAHADAGPRATVVQTPTDDRPAAAEQPAARPAKRPSSRRSLPRSTKGAAAPVVVAPGDNSAYLTVTADPWGSLIVDGKRVADETPVFRLAVSPGRHVVKVYHPSLGRHADAQVVNLRPGDQKTLVFRP